MNWKIKNVDRNTFQTLYLYLRADLAVQPAVDRMRWQQLNVAGSSPHHVHERLNVTIQYPVPFSIDKLQQETDPTLPWAEDHFQERVSGSPLNPPPSYEDWPHHKGDTDRHLNTEGKFDHTYPERFWPRHARTYGDEYVLPPVGMKGIRFSYGDLDDVVQQLRDNYLTRQAVLPVFFPEDTGATLGQRVPCSLFYHFQYDPESRSLGATYAIRSCDLIRHYRNDVYMASRLLQWVANKISIKPGELTIHIANLHALHGDLTHVQYT